MKTKRLFCVHPKLKYPSSPCDDYTTVYCYAYSSCHAVQLAISYCVQELHWELNSFVIPAPIWIPNFISHATNTQ